ncbi:sulfate adenylyltransferase subunit CysN [Dokdonella fugitiva]|jgi:bifunctional enzyme CysN/CysC|uniref:Multifunctional fusion protein n=1 Tax=Dokdonella fugitiva TaxID=328517 RepID=A0A4R2I7I1_9GAMM|nr:sulfate adenylyltransferase subunit CysN [Dokdonella fugitiva]TCO39866.1 bifunctional enzyme CysN/CysC [Dokdonella fugitiva]
MNAEGRFEDVEAYLIAQQAKGLLRFITCGSVDDGKSTLIGRLLHESKALFDDQLAALEGDSRKFGTQGDELDFALLLDGLGAEREQGITIDVAYRFFVTEKRKFIVADTPGHEQYTRNMITGASTADLAVILVDARKGLLTQTRRHSYLVSLVGIRRIVLAVNKLDLVDWSQEVFESIERDYRAFAAQLGIEDVVAIPLSALRGDNLSSPSARTPWYRGPSLLQHLETVDVGGDDASGPLRLPVQWVNRPDLDFRGYSGRILGGRVRPGDAVRVLPSGRTSTVARIVTFDGDLAEARSGQSVTLTLTDDIDISRGDVICAAGDPAGLADQFEATLVWMADAPMLPGRPYLVKLGATTLGASFGQPKYVVDVNSLEHLAAKTLELNGIGVANLTLDRAVAFDPYASNRDMGSFIVIDRYTNQTVGAGLLHFALRRSQNIHWQAVEVDKQARIRQNGHSPCVLWLTGLSGSGKSTIANIVERQLHALGARTYLLDGDNVRHGLSKDLGFTDADRVENIRRIGEVARLMVDAGLIVITAFISPFRSERQLARGMVEDGEFIEIFVDTPLAVVEQRDPKGLYKKARRGELKNFTGIDSPYEVPAAPELHLRTMEQSPEESASAIVDLLVRRGVIRRSH